MGNYLADFDSDFYVTNKYELPIASGMKIIVKDKENGFSLKGIAVNEKKPEKVWNVMVKKGYGALIIGANSSCSNLNFFKKGDYPYKLCTFAPPSVNY